MAMVSSCGSWLDSGVEVTSSQTNRICSLKKSPAHLGDMGGDERSALSETLFREGTEAVKISHVLLCHTRPPGEVPDIDRADACDQLETARVPDFWNHKQCGKEAGLSLTSGSQLM